MAVEVIAVFSAGEEHVDVWVAARAEEVVAAAAGAVTTVPGERVRDYGHHGPHVGEAGPEAVVGGDVGLVELLAAGVPEAFTGVWGFSMWLRRG